MGGPLRLPADELISILVRRLRQAYEGGDRRGAERYLAREPLSTPLTRCRWPNAVKTLHYRTSRCWKVGAFTRRMKGCDAAVAKLKPEMIDSTYLWERPTALSPRV